MKPKKIQIKFLYAFIVSVCSFLSALAIEGENYSVQVSAIVQETPAQITLVWKAKTNQGDYKIYKRTTGANTSWGSIIATPDNTDTSYIDTDVIIGQKYEYKIERGSSADGYISAGIKIPLCDNFGKVIFLIDNSLITTLSEELILMEKMMVADGWQIIRREVDPTATVPEVKAIITEAYELDPTNTKSLYLFGNIPVPYSGRFEPDGHTNHRGAQPADVFYGDIDGNWTDNTVTYTSASYSGDDPTRNHNRPGDGKYDQNMAPSEVELEVGRVDLSNLPRLNSYGSEIDHLRNYIQKNYNYRYKIFDLQRRAVVYDGFQWREGTPSVDVYREASFLFGQNKLTDLASDEFLDTLSSTDFVWAHAEGGGWFEGADGVGSTTDLTVSDPRACFYSVVGSWFADWDTEDNFLRAFLTTPTYGLTSVWTGYHHRFAQDMALGATIGNSVKVYHNNTDNSSTGYTLNVRDYTFYQDESVHIGLMGDPTLRLFPVYPVTDIAANNGTVSWTASADNNIVGYHVYKANQELGPYSRLTDDVITATTYTDASGTVGDWYMVRAIKLEETGSGTFYNASQGIMTANLISTGTLNIEINGNNTICEGESVTLTASGADSYTWSTGAATTSITVSPSTTTTYSVAGETTDDSGIGTFIVRVNNTPNANAGNDIIIAEGASTTLTATGGDIFEWSTGDENAEITVSPIETTEYTVTVTSSENCSASDDVIVTVQEIVPVNVIIEGNESICPGESVTLVASGADSYLWNTGETRSSITVEPSELTTYSVTGQTETGSGTADFTITVNPIPDAYAGEDVTIAPGEATTLTASGGTYYRWTNGRETAEISVSPSRTFTYIVTVTSDQGCTDSDTVTVTINDNTNPITVSIVGENAICAGENATLTASGADSYTWNTGETTSSITISPNTTTTYSVIGQTGTETGTADFSVIVNPIPDAYAGEDVTITTGGNTTLTATGGTSYQWSNGRETAEITVSPTETIEYFVTVTSAESCSDTDTVLVTVEASIPIAVLIEGAETICQGESVTLTASGANSYTWNTGEETTSITVTPLTTTTYSVTGLSGSETDTEEFTITVNSIPDANAGDDVTITFGESTILNATGGTSYAWSNNSETAEITVSPASTTSYIVTVSNAEGCSDSDTILVTVNNPSPLTILVEGTQTICEGESLTLTASGADSYTWSTGETTNSITISPNATTTYSVVGETANNAGSAEYTVTVNELPNAYAGEDITIESGESTVLTATGGSSYEWSNGRETAEITVSPSGTITYIVTVTSDQNCSNSDTVVVTVNDNTTITISVNGSQSICQGESVTITAAGADSYMWSTGETTTSIEVSPSETTTYSVTGTSGTNSWFADVMVNVISLPEVNAGDDVTIANGESTVLSATGGVSYIWSNSRETAEITVSPSRTIRYIVTATTEEGCSNSDTVEVFVTQELDTSVLILKSGWNLISFPVITDDMSINTMFAGHHENIDMIKSEEFYNIPVQPDFLNNLYEIAEGQGYLIRMREDTEVQIDGYVSVPSSVSVTLQEGWNIVGYPYREENSIDELFPDISQYILQIKNFEGFFEYNGTQNSINTMKPKNAYFIKVSQDCTLEWR